MDVTKLKKEIKETIFPNGEKKIKGQKHQDMLFGLVDEIDRSDGLMRADIALNQEMAMENRGNINDLRGDTTDKFGKVDASISDINIRETETSKELDSIKNALRDVTSGKDNGQVTGGKVINIPTQATNSVAGYKIGGLTATNMINQKKYSDARRVRVEIEDSSLRLIKTEQTNGYVDWFYTPKDILGARIYFQAKVIEATGKTNIGFFNGSASKISPVNTDAFKSVYSDPVVDAPSTNIFRIYLDGDVGSTATYSVVAINLTELFGAGDEPTKEWCDEHFPEYFDGTKSIKTPLRLSCGDSKLFINSEVELKTGDVINDGVLNGKKLNTSGTLVTKPDSKVVVDYAKNATLLYNKGLKIDDIKTLDILQKFEADGSITSLDVAKATYTDMVLTHPELKDLDVCYVEYIYDSGIYGNNTITYGIDKFITDTPLISPDGRKWRKIEVATNEGILTTKLEEVK